MTGPAQDWLAGRWAQVRSSPYLEPVGWWFLMLAMLAVVASLKAWTQWQFTVAPPWSDWQTQANAVARLLAGESLFAPQQLSGPYNMPTVVLTGWTYPPASLIVLLPFAAGTAGLIGWIVLNVALLLGGLAAVLKRELGSVLPWPMAIVLLGLALFRPFAEGVAAGNVNVALAGIYAFCWASDERRWWIAPAAGLAATFKVFPGLLALWAARRQGLRPIVVAAAVALGLSLLSVFVVGPQAWRDFVTALLNAQPPCFSYNTLSIACLFQPVTGITVAKLLGYVAVALLALGVLLVRDRYWAFVLLGAAMLAGVTDMHLHFWVFGYVALVVGLARAFARGRTVDPVAVARDAEEAGGVARIIGR